MVVNTCGWVDGLGFELLIHSIKQLAVDIVLVMGHDKFHAQLANLTEAHVVALRLYTTQALSSSLLSACPLPL